LTWVDGKTNPADLFTKPLPRPTLEEHMTRLRLIETE